MVMFFNQNFSKERVGMVEKIVVCVRLYRQPIVHKMTLLRGTISKLSTRRVHTIVKGKVEW